MLSTDLKSTSISKLRSEYLRLAGIAASEQQRFAFSAKPNFVALAKAGEEANKARVKWMDALRA